MPLVSEKTRALASSWYLATPRWVSWKSSCVAFWSAWLAGGSLCVPFAGPVTEVSSSVSGGEWSLREAACTATSCRCFARLFLGLLWSVRCLRLYRVGFGLEKGLCFTAFSRCTESRLRLSLSWFFEEEPCERRKLALPRPVSFCLLAGFIDTEGFV